MDALQKSLKSLAFARSVATKQSNTGGVVRNVVRDLDPSLKLRTTSLRSDCFVATLLAKAREASLKDAL